VIRRGQASSTSRAWGVFGLPPSTPGTCSRCGCSRRRTSRRTRRSGTATPEGRWVDLRRWPTPRHALPAVLRPGLHQSWPCLDHAGVDRTDGAANQHGPAVFGVDRDRPPDTGISSHERAQPSDATGHLAVAAAGPHSRAAGQPVPWPRRHPVVRAHAQRSPGNPDARAHVHHRPGDGRPRRRGSRPRGEGEVPPDDRSSAAPRPRRARRRPRGMADPGKQRRKL
jgi:hypothetical protein